MKPGAMLFATLAAFLVAASCGGESTPETTVRDYYDALSRGNAVRLPDLFVPEVADSMLRTRLQPIAVENLIIRTVSTTDDSALLTAEYDVDFPEIARIKATISLLKRGQRWLISELTQEKAGE